MECMQLFSKEYFEIVKIVGEFDLRLLTIKGWGITFSLATLVVAFQQKNRGLFIAVVISSLSFWLLEGAVKGHQMRYYPRMVEIEEACKDKIGGPRIDSSWQEAVPSIFSKIEVKDGSYKLGWAYWLRWFLPHVMLPHVVTLIVAGWFVWRDPGAKLFLGQYGDTS